MVTFTSQVSFVLLFLLFAATTFHTSLCTTNSTTRCNKNDQRLLLIFKQGVVDPSNYLSSWTSEGDCCSWLGVQCDNITGRVTELHLDDQGFQGEINLCLLQLEFLEYLSLQTNGFVTVTSSSTCQTLKSYNQSFASPFNQSAKFSSALRYLDFSYNGLVINNLHWLSQLSSLKYLDLSYNDIGNETKWLHYMAMLPSLSELHLTSCELRNFPFLNYVNFTSLVSLYLNANRINSLHDSFFNFTRDITHIDLSSNYLYGQVPVALFKLRNLKSLSLSYNFKLKGSIPEWLGQHEYLQEFYVSDNLFSGPIPSSLGNISSLIELDLSHNQFSGSLPISIGQLHDLKLLSIGGNSLVGVLSEKNFANLTNLSYLYAGSNGFKSIFDPNWAPPFQLEYLDLGDTSLGPNVPAWIYTQRSLDTLYIHESGISTMDADVFWGFVARIDYVDVSNNLINGDISNVRVNSSYINLSHNNFSGGLPQLSANVNRFVASHNSFSGSISSLLCHPKSNGESMLLEFLDLSFNRFSGALPDCWANWKQLEYLDLGSNMLTGEVPPSMALLMNLQKLNLSDNSLFGKFSLDISNWTNLEHLLLENNKFSGSLPNKMQQNLMVIKLRANQFIGNIPSQICNLSSLRILDLAHNNLSGSIPHCMYNIMRSHPESFDLTSKVHLFTKGREFDYQDEFILKIIDFSNNNLSGEIPKELFNLTEMWSLNLSRNHLMGKIPKEIGAMKSLESLDLSYNRLYGEIPSTISNLSFLDYLNLSYNNFFGQIPLGTQIQSFDSWSFVGNLDLCGDPLPKKCTMKEASNHNSEPVEGNEDDDFLKSLYLGMGVGFAAGFWGVCGSLFLIRSWRHKFFQLFQLLVDRLYVIVALKLKKLKASNES